MPQLQKCRKLRRNYNPLYFKRYREEYYRLLQEVRLNGVWEAWIEFFLRGVIETSEQAIKTATGLLHLFETDRRSLQTEARSVLRLHDHLQRVPIMSVSGAAKAIEVSLPTATKALKTLERRGLAREVTGGKYGKTYVYAEYLAILNADDESLELG